MIHRDLAKFTSVRKFKIFLKQRVSLTTPILLVLGQLNFFSKIYLSKLISLGYIRARDWEWFFRGQLLKGYRVARKRGGGSILVFFLWLSGQEILTSCNFDKNTLVYNLPGWYISFIKISVNGLEPFKDCIINVVICTMWYFFVLINYTDNKNYKTVAWQNNQSPCGSVKQFLKVASVVGQRIP